MSSVVSLSRSAFNSVRTVFAAARTALPSARTALPLTERIHHVLVAVEIGRRDGERLVGEPLGVGAELGDRIVERVRCLGRRIDVLARRLGTAIASSILADTPSAQVCAAAAASPIRARCTWGSSTANTR
jgi:hypothetical protein